MSKKELTPEEKKQQAREKFQSRRFWFSVWAAVLATGIVAGSYIRDNYEMTGIAVTCIGLVAAYVSLETVNKKFKYKNQEASNE